MSHPTAESLARSFKLTHWIIKQQTDGLTNADSLIQPPFRGNCLNWVLGHIIVGRNTVLELLGEEPVWDEKERVIYMTGSEPLSSEGQALSLDKLLGDLDRSQERIMGALERISPDGLGKVVTIYLGEKSVEGHIAGLHWHETYHTGQLELLRQLAGTNDAIILKNANLEYEDYPNPPGFNGDHYKH